MGRVEDNKQHIPVTYESPSDDALNDTAQAQHQRHKVKRPVLPPIKLISTLSLLRGSVAVGFSPPPDHSTHAAPPHSLMHCPNTKLFLETVL